MKLDEESKTSCAGGLTVNECLKEKYGLEKVSLNYENFSPGIRKEIPFCPVPC